MRKLLLFFFWGVIFLPCYAKDDVELSPSSEMSEIHRDEQAPVNMKFYAEVVSNSNIKIITERQSSFSVTVFVSDSEEPLYHGSTENGCVHFTTPLSTNCYTIVVEVDGIIFTGQLTIDN